MAENSSRRLIRMLILDDDAEMCCNLCDACRRFNDGEIAVPKDLGESDQWEISPTSMSDFGKIGDSLKAKPTWEVIVIDRHFFGTDSYKNIVILEPLRDLQVDAVRIVWTAYPEEEDIIASMGLGAWDYLNKKKPRYGNTYTDVIVSAIQGLKQKESELRRAVTNRDGSEFVTKRYGEIYSKHKGNFIALERAATGEWNVDPIAADPSLFGLYEKIGNRKREEIYVVFIGE